MPATAEDRAGRRLALVVATGSYADRTLSGLRAPGRDATDLAAVLEDPAVGGFEVETVLDAPGEVLRRRVAQFCAQTAPGDLALVYLSCHGVLDDRGRLYYAAADTDHSLLAATAISSAWLNEQLDDCRCRRQILVLDCCHSGAFAKGSKGAPNLALAERFEGRGRVVLTGSRATEYSFEHDHVIGESASSVFTGAIVEGLRSGEADRDGDGLVTVGELYDYVYASVRAREARQTPTLWTYGAEGDLLIAHSPRGPIAKPAGLPELAGPPTGHDDPPIERKKSLLPRRRRKLAGGAAATATVVLAVVLAATSLTGDKHAVSPIRIALAGSPYGVAVDEHATWVATHKDGRVSKIGPALGNPSTPVAGVEKIAAGEGAVWVSAAGGKELVRIDPVTRAVTAKVPVDVPGCGCPITRLEIAQGALWTSSDMDREISKRDLITGEEVQKEYKPGVGFHGAFAVSANAVWAVATDGLSPPHSWVIHIDIPTGYVTRRDLGVSSFFNGVAYGNGTVWIADAGDEKNFATAFYPGSQQTADIKINTGVYDDDIAVMAGSVFVWNAEDGILTLIDARKLKVSHSQRIEGFRTAQRANRAWSDLAVDRSAAWVTDPVGKAIYEIAY